MTTRSEVRAELEDRIAVLAARIADPDETERRYASTWLDRLWRLHEASLRAEERE